jgi:hypothetical protein
VHAGLAGLEVGDRLGNWQTRASGAQQVNAQVAFRHVLGQVEVNGGPIVDTILIG